MVSRGSGALCGDRAVGWRAAGLGGRGPWPDARRVVVGEPSLRWLQRLQAVALAQGVQLAPLMLSQSGALTFDGWTLEPWLEGRPGMPADLANLRSTLRRMHRATRGWPPRPGLVPRMPLRVKVVTAEVAAVHGDVHPGNVLRLAGGGLALIDWEEARLGDTRLDLGYPSDASGRAAHAAAEVVACWQAEPQRARSMARLLHALR